MALQIYAAMSLESDVSPSTLTVSLLFSMASVSFTVIRYMNKLLKLSAGAGGQQNNEKDEGSSVNNGSISNIVSKIKDAKPGKAPMIILGFVVSDFVIRSVPVCLKRTGFVKVFHSLF